jgi:hypothetical protein
MYAVGACDIAIQHARDDLAAHVDNYKHGEHEVASRHCARLLSSVAPPGCSDPHRGRTVPAYDAGDGSSAVPYTEGSGREGSYATLALALLMGAPQVAADTLSTTISS